MIDLSVVIVNWNTKKLLADCLDSIFKQPPGINYEVIVVDNGSTDGSKEYLRNIEEKKKSKSLNLYNSISLKVIFNNQNLGFTKANNQGIKIAKGKYILLLNSDTKIKDNALKKLVNFAEGKKSLGVAGPRLLNFDQTVQPSISPFLTLPNVFLWLFTGDRFLYSSPKQTCQVDWVMGSALMIKKEVAETVGFLDEKFFMYMEEVEWCYRIKKAGFGVWFYPEAEIYHLVRGSSPAGKQNAILGIYQGLIYFYQKHFAPWQLAVLKLLLGAKAKSAFLLGLVSGNQELKETYEKAGRLACHV